MVSLTRIVEYTLVRSQLRTWILTRTLLSNPMFPDQIFMRVSGGRILFINTKIYPSRHEEFDEKISIFIQTCPSHDSLACSDDLGHGRVYFRGS